MANAQEFLAAFGGADNIEDIEGCITRLRTAVYDPDMVDEAQLKALGAQGVSVAGTMVQVVVGPIADMLAEDIQELL